MSNINKIKVSGQTYNIQDENATKTVELTQAQYDALVVKDPNTFYIITDAEAGDLTAIENRLSEDEEVTAAGLNVLNESKQDTLVSGTNIKTINNESILGGGNINIQGGGSSYTAGRGIDITNDVISFSLPISAGTGTNSVIEGNTNNKASSSSSHAEGSNTTASGSSSHAEGSNTTASGDFSHAEGNVTTASGRQSHAEGFGTIASGNSSHAEGSNTTASGTYSHAEGVSTTASGSFSHAEGYNTKTTNQSEHASGQFNVSNTGSYNANKTIFSVGNGTADNIRHNAFEIRQNGDIYLALDGQDVKLQDQLGGSSITVDSALSSTSENPVQNKVIYSKIDEVEQVTAAGLNALNNAFGGLKLMKISQTDYDNLQVKDQNTLYIIVN